MKKLTFIALLICWVLTATSQSLAGEYICHYKLNQPGIFIYYETGENYFTISISEKGEVKVKMNIGMREEKTKATNYVNMTGSAEGEMLEGTNSFKVNGIIVFSIYEKEVMDTRWDIDTWFTGSVVDENGVLKMKGTIKMTQGEEETTASFSGSGKSLKIPYTLTYKLGYDYGIEDKVAFPLAIKIDYEDDNYIVKNADILKIYVPNTDMIYDYTKKGTTTESYSYQTQDPNDRGAVFGPSYNINLVENDNLLGLEFKDINESYLQMLPANATLCYVTKVAVFSIKDNKLQQVTDTFKIKVKNHFKVSPLANGKYEKAMVGNVLLDAGSGARFFPLGSLFKIPIGTRMMVQFIDGTLALLEYPVNKSYPDLNITIGLGISADQGVNGEGNVIQCKLEKLSEKGVQKGASQLGKATLKLLLSTAQKANSITQLFDFFAASEIGGDKPVVLVKLRSVVGILLGTDGSFVLKNYEGHPDVVTNTGTSSVPAGQEFDLASAKFQIITPDADFDGLRNVLTGSSASGNNNKDKGLLDKLTGQYLYFTAAGCGMLLLLVLVFFVRRMRKKKAGPQ